ncbi:MAG: DNA helicase RecQ [Gammaproteobacteria bacterium]|nr:DNA helicase RecQ [Gammaproteobacteria bacterium]
MQQAITILNQTFGYEAFRHHQQAIIEQLAQGGDALVLMPTGGGKSLCYQIPSLMREGTGVVISPLIALMQDQVEALRQLGISAAYLNSTLDNETQNQTISALLNGDLKLLYIAPERLMSSRMLDILSRTRVALFAIDEAHCVSQWGHDFRKDYQQLSILHQRFPDVPRVALTATADPRTREEIVSQLALEDAQVFVNSFDRPNIHYAISDAQNARERLWQFIQQQHADDAGIIYCLSRKRVEEVAQWLSSKGRVALPYHAGLSAEIRQRNQQRFLREDSVIVVATIAFGMGIDKPDVRFVAHLNLPKTIEAYYQETGRAGRDGEPANAWLNYSLQDLILLRQMIEDSDAAQQFKQVTHHKLEALIGLCEATTCRRQILLAYFGEKRSEPCGNCDVCLSPPQTWDATEASRKALSCIYRTGQRFGVNYVIDVLTGKDDQRIQQNAHDKLSTFGIGKELNATDWRSVFRQLIAKGYIAADMHRHGAIFLTEQARGLLRGEETLQLRQSVTPVARKEREEKKTSAMRVMDEDLFNALREKRRELAQQNGVPPYIIFHDQTLQSMARLRPLNLEAMRFISGVGEQKLQRYGEVFLKVVQEFPLPDLLNNKLSDTVNETLFMLTQDMDAEAIAKHRKLTVSTVYNHLADAIEAGLLNPLDVLPIDKDVMQEIIYAIEMSEDDRLKPVYESFNGEYDYGLLRCVQASL